MIHSTNHQDKLNKTVKQFVHKSFYFILIIVNCIFVLKAKAEMVTEKTLEHIALAGYKQ